MFQKNMKLIFLCLLIGCTTVLGVPGQAKVEEDTKPAIDVIPSSSTVPTSSSSSSTTTTPTTTTTTTTTTTPPTTPPTPPTPPTTPPTTTTPTTTTTTTTPTTTSASTTTTPKTTSTTPSTTTAAPPTPAPPTPKPDIGKWNASCIILQMSAQLNFTYTKNDQKNATALYNIPANATVHDHECSSNASQSLVLQWGTDVIVNTATFQFDKNGSNINLEMILFKIQAVGTQFPNATANETIQLVYRGNIFEAPLHMSYHCTREQKYNLTAVVDNSPPIGFVKFANVQVEAFKDASSTKFSTANDCDASNTPDIVPIAVGIALCALILIILIAYLAARRRWTVSGYMSF